MQIEYKYPAILYGHLDCWLFFTVKKNLFNQLAARTTSLYPLCFSYLVNNEQKYLTEKKVSWIKNNLLGILVCSIPRKNTQQYYTPKHLIRYIY